MNIPSNKVKSVISYFRKELTDYYDSEEIENFIFFSFEKFLRFSRTDLVMKSEICMSESVLLKFNNVVKELKKHKPIQYILGETEFYGLKLKVNENVLIPRPETEELVHFIISDHRSKNKSPDFKPNILDIGTGSGCIAIALKKNIPEANVFALDVSDEALSVAKENAKNNKTEVIFFKADVLRDSEIQQLNNYDIIVSNPPYVRLSEKEVMNKNVLDYEPHLALFVDNEAPLLFYEAIADFAKRKLNPLGKLYFEINESLGKEMQEMLEQKGFRNILIKKDLRNKERMIRGDWGIGSGQ